MKELVLCDNEQLEDTLKLCKKYNTGIEIQVFFDPAVCDNTSLLSSHIEALKDVKTKSMHGPFGDLNAGSFDKMIRETTINRFELGYEVAQKLGVSSIVYHTGFVPNTSPPSGWIKRCAETWDDFLEGKSEDVTFYIENMLEFTPEVLKDLLQEIGKDNVQACLDIGHAHALSKTPAIEWIKALGNKIGYVHLHDNHGESDEHLGLGTGTMNVKEVCDTLNEYAPDAIWAIEAEGEGLKSSVKWLIENQYV